MDKSNNIISLFSGAGGMDLGFQQAGFKIIWANEHDKNVCPTYLKNFKHSRNHLDTRSITDIPNQSIPRDITGLIGGPPCQSWSQAGSRKGITDKRGQLINDYIRVVKHSQPHFFVMENVAGLVNKKNRSVYESVLAELESLGYLISDELLNAADYGVPQDRRRIFIVGYSKKYFDSKFSFPIKETNKVSLECIRYLENYSIGSDELQNHDVDGSGFSYIYMSRNRVREWNQQSYTILASQRHIPIHPNFPKMVKVKKDIMRFVDGYDYRRLSVRECAEIQTFPKDFTFIYDKTVHGYKMVGNAVPVKLAYTIAKKIKHDIKCN